ncbi:hypothetical protein [Cupriavidus sp. H39]|uniref:hypothetical protein n=1 Tax=Cupriavidus sp. H39 TaxID=3401635 RepID=UPI003CFDC844
MSLQISYRQFDAFISRKVDDQRAWALESGKPVHPRNLVRGVIVEMMLRDLLDGFNTVEALRQRISEVEGAL